MDQQQQVQPQQQQEVQRWREYYYAPANKVGSDVYVADASVSVLAFRASPAMSTALELD